jgi:ATPase subunit of ABC transporter with duplicated ATPase domains
LVGQVSAAIGRSQKQPRQTGQLTEQSTLKPDATNRQDLNSTLTDKSLEAQIPPVMIGDANVHCYRNQERNRIIAILKADSSVLVVGREGMGKTTLVEAVVRHLRRRIQGTSGRASNSKNMLKSMAEQLQISLKTMEGTSLTADGLRSVIKTHLMQLQRDEKYF